MKITLSVAVALFSACAVVNAGDIVTIAYYSPRGCIGARGNRAKYVGCNESDIKWYLDSDGRIRLNSNRNKCLMVGYGSVLEEGTQMRVLDCKNSSLKKALQTYTIADDIRPEAFPDYALIVQGSPHRIGNNIIVKLRQNIGGGDYSWDIDDADRRNLKGSSKAVGGWELTYYEE